jgi:LacI family transcriptional regulator
VAQSGATLKRLAAELRLSVATVSRALAGHPMIAEDTRARVRRAAEAAGYVPNRAAKALVSGRSGFVGLVLPIRGHGREDPFLGDFVTGLGAGLARHGTDLFLSAVPEGQSELEVIRHIVDARRADGLVLARTTEDDARVAFLAGRRFPFVTHGRTFLPGIAHGWLDTDGAAAFGEAFALLHGLGHRRFALMTIAEPMTFRRHREEGLAAAIAACADPEVRLETVVTPRFDRAARAAAVDRLLGRPDRPTAIIGLFDGLALAVIEGAARAGLAVPSDLSVTGFDDVSAAAHVPPGLTTFDAAVRESATALAGMLVRAIAAPEGPPETGLVTPRLILRGSHGPASGR